MSDRSTAAEAAELSTLRSQLAELRTRVSVLADRHRDEPDSAGTPDLYGAERSLITAERALEKASRALTRQA